VLALCIAAGVHFKKRVEQEHYHQTENIAQVLMANFENDVAVADAILTRLTTEIPEGAVSETNEAELHRLLAAYALQPSMIGPGMLDQGGTLIASAIAHPVAKVSLKDRNIFRVHADAPDNSNLYISAPMRGVITNEWAIQFSKPLRDKAGALRGVV